MTVLKNTYKLHGNTRQAATRSKTGRKPILKTGKHFSNLHYADNMVLISTPRKALEEMMNELQDESRKIGLTINLDKTKDKRTSL